MLRDIDLTVRSGEVLGIPDPPLRQDHPLHLIAGLEDPEQGRDSAGDLADADVLIGADLIVGI